MKEKRTRSRWALYLITLVFLVPFILAWWFLQFSDYVDVGKKSNYGLLITPVRSLPVRTITDALADGRSRSLDGRWSLFYVLPSDCDDVCKRTLYSLYQIEQLMGKDSLRVQRVALMIDSNAVSVEWHPAQWLLKLDAVDLPTFLDLLRLSSTDDPVNSGHVYIIDPQGSLIMRYPRDFDPSLFIKDLKKLLKASRIG